MQVLVVEDDVLLAECLGETLLDDGHVVCGVTSSVAEAVALARRHRPDIAILDMQLRDGERGSEVADQLDESGDLGRTGILYVSGASDRVIRDARIGHACLNKPYTSASLAAALGIVQEIARDGVTSRELPRGMRLLNSVGTRPQTAL
jgi:CheY-like chemotaxis protein